MAGGLESIESDKEGEIRLTSRKNSIQKNKLNEDLFDCYEGT